MSEKKVASTVKQKSMSSSCHPQNQVPAVWKTLGSILQKGTAENSTQSTVCCDTTTCTKTFSDQTAYERERDIYALRLPYVPKMLAHDDGERSITTQRIGTPLGNVWTSGHPFAPLFRNGDDLHAHDACINEVRRRFHRDTGMHHNDIQYKNVLYDAGSYFLIDFEAVSATEAIRYDPDHIRAATG